jgi:hypothetical protein
MLRAGGRDRCRLAPAGVADVLAAGTAQPPHGMHIRRVAPSVSTWVEALSTAETPGNIHTTRPHCGWLPRARKAATRLTHATKTLTSHDLDSDKIG